MIFLYYYYYDSEPRLGERAREIPLEWSNKGSAPHRIRPAQTKSTQAATGCNKNAAVYRSLQLAAISALQHLYIVHVDVCALALYAATGCSKNATNCNELQQAATGSNKIVAV